jgi:predicted secreted protein
VLTIHTAVVTEPNPPGVAFVAHCLLNQNSKTDGGARCPGIYSPLVDLLRERGWRIEQMPCPEHAFLGMHRFWLVKDQADTLAFRRHCRRQAKVVAGAIAVHVERGTDVVVIGVEGSPSMGVRITSSSADWGGRPDKGDDDYPLVPGRGIFSEELVAELAERGLGDVRASGIEHQLPTYDEAAEREQISALLEHPDGR